MEYGFIKEYWENQAKQYQDSHSASWGDIYMINLEIQNIGRFISVGDAVFDVGCGNGYSTFQLLDKGVKLIKGIDFSENMIRQANIRKSEMNLGDIISFDVGDIRDLKFEDALFDVVYTTRVLINLPSWEEQKKGIDECLRVTKPGGKVLFSEAFWEPLVLLNSLRALKQLSPLVEHDFNRYLKKKWLEDFFMSKNLTFENIDFSSIYYLGSRFLRELVTDIDQYPGYSNPINEIFYKIEQEYSGGNFGIQQIYVISK